MTWKACLVLVAYSVLGDPLPDILQTYLARLVALVVLGGILSFNAGLPSLALKRGRSGTLTVVTCAQRALICATATVCGIQVEAWLVVFTLPLHPNQRVSLMTAMSNFLSGAASSVTRYTIQVEHTTYDCSLALWGLAHAFVSDTGTTQELWVAGCLCRIAEKAWARMYDAHLFLRAW